MPVLHISGKIIIINTLKSDVMLWNHLVLSQPIYTN